MQQVKKTLKTWSEGISQAVSSGFNIKKLPSGELPFHYVGAWVFANQGKFHPLKYLVALRKKAEKLGVQFFEHTEALSIEGDGDVMVSTRSGRVHALYVIQATYQPFENPSKLFMKKGMYVSYILELSIPHGVLPIGTYLDDCNPYHYFRIDRDTSAHDRMIIGGEDRREELPNNDEKSFAALEDYLKTYFPDLEYEIVRKWNGPILESIDGRAFIGRYDKHHPNRFVATAFSGNGMTYAHLAAEILSGEIENNRHQFAYLYDPMRPILRPKSLLVKTKDYVGTLFGGYIKNLLKIKNI
jgi:glycine/D-amino acid oxidase-like deaminating enzyme